MFSWNVRFIFMTLGLALLLGLPGCGGGGGNPNDNASVTPHSNNGKDEEHDDDDDDDSDGNKQNNLAPKAKANGSYSGTVGVAINFSSAGSNDPDGSIVAYLWEFGDGESSDLANPSHAYASAGKYRVKLTVTDNSGDTDTDTTEAEVKDGGGGGANLPPNAKANGPYAGTTGVAISFSSAGSSDPDGSIAAYAWDFGDGASSTAANPSHSYASAGTYTVSLTVTDNGGASANDTTSAVVTDGTTPPPQTIPNVSINSTSQNGTPGMPVAEQPFTGQSGFRVFASNDLGMHCGDLDTRISSILPPFNVVHAQVIQRGSEPNILTPADGVEVVYSAASNPTDPILSGVNSAGSGPVASSMLADGSVYKTNFWDIANEAYDAFYPPGILSAFYPPGGSILDLGLPVPNTERLFLGDGTLTAEQQEMPGRFGPYAQNTPVSFKIFTVNQPFFIDFPFGYTAAGVNWFEAAGIPMTTYDDFGRENPWPLVRVQARSNGAVLASLDTVLPISGEANCGYCHNDPVDGGNGAATEMLSSVALSIDDTANVPADVSREWASDINILRLHDQKHGTNLVVGTTMDNPPGSTPFKAVVCQTCHYTPALDLAQLGPRGPENDPDPTFGPLANGRDQIKNKSMSNVMHSHHASVRDLDGNLLFPAMPPAVDSNGNLRNSLAARDILDQTCYQCHPGRRTDCLRGAMANGGMLCQDCHGDMAQIGNDFTRNVSASNPGAFELASDFYTNPATPRVPWANEPSCGSCHTGDAMDNLHGAPGTVGDPDDGIRLMQAYLSTDSKATPIVPSNKRFAENAVPSGPAAGNPMLYRVSKGHKGVFCEACHGATHGIWPNKNPKANDNVAAMQLQGHTGTITECSTCHTGDMGINLDGPHGMHPIGDAGTRFADGGHGDLAENNRNACRACHGRNGEGTVLSAMKQDRTLQCDKSTSFCPNGNSVLFPKGHQVGCTECHGNKL